MAPEYKVRYIVTMENKDAVAFFGGYLGTAIICYVIIWAFIVWRERR